MCSGNIWLGKMYNYGRFRMDMLAEGSLVWDNTKKSNDACRYHKSWLPIWSVHTVGQQARQACHGWPVHWGHQDHPQVSDYVCLSETVHICLSVHLSVYLSVSVLFSGYTTDARTICISPNEQRLVNPMCQQTPETVVTRPGPGRSQAALLGLSVPTNCPMPACPPARPPARLPARPPFHLSTSIWQYGPIWCCRTQKEKLLHDSVPEVNPEQILISLGPHINGQSLTSHQWVCEKNVENLFIYEICRATGLWDCYINDMQYLPQFPFWW